MRIISGKYKGHPVKFPNSKLVRPTTDRNRETIFNFLNNIFEFEGAIVCELFAGSGALGLEALSRGAMHIDFVEKNYKVSRVLLENIEKLKAAEYCNVIVGDAAKFSKNEDHSSYDLILADPPYFDYHIYEIVERIKLNKFLTPVGMMIIERSIQTVEKDTEKFGVKPVKNLSDSVIYLIE